MKEASGEVSMTLIVIVAAAAIITFFTVVLWPQAKDYINSKWKTFTKDAEIVIPLDSVIR